MELTPDANYLSRREFAGGLLAALMVGPQILSAAEQTCTVIDIKSYQQAVRLDAAQVAIWVTIDAFSKRARLVFSFARPQNPDRYITKAVLVTESFDTIAIRYYQQTSGLLPLFVISNFPLVFPRYYMLVLVRENGVDSVYRYPLTADELAPGTIGANLPPDVATAIKSAPHKGVISSYFYLKNRLVYPAACTKDKASHCAVDHFFQAQIMTIKGSIFTIQIDFTHPDLRPDHYPRYFIVTDPVGRLLAYKHRIFKDKANGRIVLTSISPAAAGAFHLKPTQIGDIRNIPYIMVFMDDGRDALTRQDIWLR